MDGPELLKQPPVKVFGIRPGVAGKKTFVRTSVVVTRDVAAFEVVLVPLVKGVESVTQKAGGKSAAVAVEMINPSSSTPEPREGESSLAKKDSAAASKHTTTLYLIPCRVDTETKDRFMPPFWCVKHGASQDANMERDEVEVDAILRLLTGNEQKSSARPSTNPTSMFSIPVMTNFKALLKGTELVFAKTDEVEKPKKKQEKSTTWLAGATKEFKADMKKSG